MNVLRIAPKPWGLKASIEGDKERVSGIEVTFCGNRVTCKECRAEARK